MSPLLLWIAIPPMLLGAGMLVAGIGSTALWIALIAIGIALAVIGQFEAGRSGTAATDTTSTEPRAGGLHGRQGKVE